MIELLLFAWLSGQVAGSDAAREHVQAGLEARKQHQADVEIAEFRKASELDSRMLSSILAWLTWRNAITA
jgi:hypothetical protein